MTSAGDEGRDGGDPVCWLDRVCDVCGRVPDDGEVDADGRCPSCVAAAGAARGPAG